MGQRSRSKAFRSLLMYGGDQGTRESVVPVVSRNMTRCMALNGAVCGVKDGAACGVASGVLCDAVYGAKYSVFGVFGEVYDGACGK